MQTAHVVEIDQPRAHLFAVPRSPMFLATDVGAGDAIGFACAAIESIGGLLPAVRFVTGETIEATEEVVTIGRELAAKVTPLTLAQKVAGAVAEAAGLESDMRDIVAALGLEEEASACSCGDLVAGLVAGMFACEPATSGLAWELFEETGSLARAMGIDAVAFAVADAAGGAQ